MSEATVTVLDTDECWRLLAGAEVGRLAIAVGGELDVFPVNISVADGCIVFRTAEGTKLVELLLNARVVIEADHWGESSAWSVVAKGTATVLEHDDVVVGAVPKGNLTWMPTRKTRFVSVKPDVLTGRSFERGEEPGPALY